MYLFKFEKGDVITNTLFSHPSSSFFIYNNDVFYNNDPNITGSLSGLQLKNISSGSVSLYEYNINRPAGSLIYPFIVKDGTLSSFKTISTSNFFDIDQFQYGDTITSSYPLSASISRFYYSEGATRKYVSPLKNILNYYTNISPHYEFSSSLGDKGTQAINLIDIPSIFYNNNINKKSIELNIYIDGVKYATLADQAGNGELRQTFPSGSNYNKVAGVALYNEGFLALTGAWSVGSLTAIEDYDQTVGADDFKWIYFGGGLQGNTTYSAGTLLSSSFEVKFAGSTDTNILTMLCRAPKGELNHSNNPTYLNKTSKTMDSLFVSSPEGYKERDDIAINNIVSSSYTTPQEFVKETYISKVGIFDENKNLIGIAKVSKPVHKTATRDFTFKLKLDI